MHSTETLARIAAVLLEVEKRYGDGGGRVRRATAIKSCLARGIDAEVAESVIDQFLMDEWLLKDEIQHWAGWKFEFLPAFAVSDYGRLWFGQLVTDVTPDDSSERD